MEWYSVRCLFRAPPDAYEERITIWRAGSLDDAIERAEQEALEYGDPLDLEYLGLAQAFHIFDESITSGSEVFSLVRLSELGAKDYIDRFFDAGSEIQQRFESSDLPEELP